MPLFPLSTCFFSRDRQTDGRNLIRRFITTRRRRPPVTRGYADTLHVRRCTYDVERRVGVMGSGETRRFIIRTVVVYIYACLFVRSVWNLGSNITRQCDRNAFFFRKSGNWSEFEHGSDVDAPPRFIVLRDLPTSQPEAGAMSFCVRTLRLWTYSIKRE